MRKYKIYYRFTIPDKYYSSMKLEHSVDAFTCGEACDKLREQLQTDDLQVNILEVYEQVLVVPENIVLPEDL